MIFMPDGSQTTVTICILLNRLKLSTDANFSHKKYPPELISNSGGVHVREAFCIELGVNLSPAFPENGVDVFGVT